MTNEQIIFNERLQLMESGSIGNTGRKIILENEDGEKEEIFLYQKRKIPAHFHTRTGCAEICLYRCENRYPAPISTACHPALFFVENLQRKSAYLCGFASYDSTKLKNYTKNHLKISLSSTGASALSTGVCTGFASTIPFLDAKTTKGIIGRDTLRFATCARHSRDDCLLRSHFSPLMLRKTITASLRSLPSGPSTGRSDGCPCDVSLCDTTA